MKRIGRITRKTSETDIAVEITLDGSGSGSIETTIPFFNHMLASMMRHSLTDIRIEACGDTDVDDHHLVEDVGICLGEALKEALGTKEGIGRYGCAFVPMDESLSHVSIDLSGRPYLVYNVNLDNKKIGDFELLQFREFFKAFSDHGGITLH